MREHWTAGAEKGIPLAGRHPLVIYYKNSCVFCNTTCMVAVQPAAKESWCKLLMLHILTKPQFLLWRKFHETKGRHSDFTPYFYCSVCSKAPPKSNLQDSVSSCSHFMINLRVAPRFRGFILSVMFLSFKVCYKKLGLPRFPCITICVWGKLFLGAWIQFCLILAWGGVSLFLLERALDLAYALKHFISWLKIRLLSCIHSFA